MLITTTLGLALNGCKKDDEIEEVEGLSNTATLNIAPGSYYNSGINIGNIGCGIYVGYDNNFHQIPCVGYGDVGFRDFGKGNNILKVDKIVEDGFSGSVAIRKGHGYLLKLTDYYNWNNISYARLYVLNISGNGTVRAQIQFPFEP